MLVGFSQMTKSCGKSHVTTVHKLEVRHHFGLQSEGKQPSWQLSGSLFWNCREDHKESSATGNQAFSSNPFIMKGFPFSWGNKKSVGSE